MNKYIIELRSTMRPFYKSYDVEANSPTEAELLAFDLMEQDEEISREWKQNAEVNWLKLKKIGHKRFPRDFDGAHHVNKEEE